MSQFLGLLTLPSFLYVMLPASMVLFAFLIQQRKFKQIIFLIQDYFITLTLVIVGYSRILFFGDSSQLLNPELWTKKFDFNDAEWFNNLMYYLDTRFYDIFGFYKLKTSSLLIILIIIYYILKGKLAEKYLVILCAFMFFSPFFIVLIHKVYPYGRTFYYLLLPGLLLAGFIINPIILRIKHFLIFVQLKKYSMVFFLLFICISILNILTFPSKNRDTTPWEYRLDWLRRNKLKIVLNQYHEISRTNSGFEFYPAEMISFMCVKENASNNIIVSNLDSIKNQDVLIINGIEKVKYLNNLKNYSLIYAFDDIWIYQSDKIKPVNVINE